VSWLRGARAIIDVEKTMAFLLEQQTKFDASLVASKANLDAETKELRKNQKVTERLINALRKSSCHQARLDGSDKRLEIQEREFKAFLDRFDAFLKAVLETGTALSGGNRLWTLKYRASH
jgi:hypothetical protein